MNYPSNEKIDSEQLRLALRQWPTGVTIVTSERDGYPVAVLISYPEYEELMHLRALASHRELVLALGQVVERQGQNEEQLMAELEKDKRAVYKSAYESNPT